MRSPRSASACTCPSAWRRIRRCWLPMRSRWSSRPGTTASCSAVLWPATASSWSCAMCRGMLRPSKSDFPISPRAACRTGSVSSVSVAMAAMCRRRWRCSVAAACVRTSARCCSRPPVRRCSTRCWRRAWSRATGTRRWTAKSGCSMAAAACSARSRGRICWPIVSAASTFIPAAHCGARANCAAPVPPPSWSWARSPMRNRSHCAPAWKAPA